MRGFILFILVVIFLFSNVQGQKFVRSSKKNIKVLVNGKVTDWSISPEIRPDRLKVYCFKEKNQVVFQTNIDTAYFSISKNDTLKFNIILNSKILPLLKLLALRI